MVKNVPKFVYGNPQGTKGTKVGKLDTTPGKVVPDHFIVPFPCPYVKTGPKSVIRIDHFGLFNALLVMWAPDVFFAEYVQGLACPHCHQKTNVKNNGWATHIRAIPGPQFTYYVLPRMYYCLGCPVRCPGNPKVCAPVGA